MGSLRDLRRDRTVVEKKFQVTPSQQFNRRFQRFVQGAQAIIDEHFGDRRFSRGSDQLSVQKCRKTPHARIISTSCTGYKEVWCFVDLTNGDVLRAKGWKTAGRPRGNIFDESDGLLRVGLHGPIYRGVRKS